MDRLNAGSAALRSALVRIGRHLRRGGAAYGVLLISLLLTALAWYYVRQTVEAQNRVRFDETTEATQQAIERRTEDYLDAMLGARALFYASESVDRGEWDDYVEGIEPNKRFEGLQALSYAEYVVPEEREAFARRAREEGLPEMRPDLDPSGERKAYFPIAYVGPLGEANANMLNYDYYAETAHREAMDRARDAGSPRATRVVYVLTEAPPNSNAHLALRTGFVVYLPVYQEGEPQGTVAERRRALEGFIVGSFVIDELLGGVFRGSFDPAIDFEVYDGGDAASSPLLYDSDGIERAGEREDDALYSEESRIEVAGREWSLYFATLPGFEGGTESNLPAFVLASGVGASLLLFGITWMLVRSRTLAESASKDLEETNRELEGANRELEAFSYSVSHDLRAPLRSIEGFSQVLLEDHAHKLDEEGKDYLGRVRAASRRMALLIDDLLDLSRVTRSALRRQTVDLSAQARQIAAELRKTQPEREVEFIIAEGLSANGDARLLRLVLENLLGNAWKFTSRQKRATIEFGSAALEGEQEEQQRGERAYFVRDNGVGFDARYAGKLFGAFQRLHAPEEFEGTGIGLATVARVVRRHRGRVWAEGEVGKGATFFFTLGGEHRQESPQASKKVEKIV
ncbi:MAG: CHASE domain-containing protein [Actinomycetota bacterium]|nr:CHASE domain-containing protein [Actinomycetota bacterium]